MNKSFFKTKKVLTSLLTVSMLSSMFIGCGDTNTPIKEDSFAVIESIPNTTDTTINSKEETDIKDKVDENASSENINNESINNEEKENVPFNGEDTSPIDNTDYNTTVDNSVVDNKEEVESITSLNKTSEIHFINTGNSDAILIKDGSGIAILVDAGDNDDESIIPSYIKNNGIKKIDYLISTHPDADHSGGLDAVINNFEIGKFFVGNSKNPGTKTYSSVLIAAANKGVNASIPLEGKKISLSNNSYIIFYNTKGGSNSNESSLVMLYVNGNDKVLLTGDIGIETENKILSSMVDVDILKVPHHGSSGSASKSFLEKTNPEFAIITVGKNNKYGHPHVEQMSLLKNNNIEVHRTDECGTIVFTSTGNGVSTSCKNGSYSSGNKSTTNSDNKNNNTVSNNNSETSNNTSTENNINTSDSINNNTNNNTGSSDKSEATFVITKSGTKYHRPSCSTIKQVKDTVTRAEAESLGYGACKRCNP